MFKWILLLSVVVVAIVVGGVAIRTFPALQRDIQRYIGMRNM
jgi:hypothetical protein